MTCTFSRIFFENEDKEGLAPNVAITARTLVWIGMIFATMFVLLRGLTNYTGYTDAGYTIGARSNNFLVIIPFTLIHLTYLSLVFSLLVFSRAPEKLYRQRVVIPILLVIAYFIQVLPSIVQLIDSEPAYSGLAYILPVGIKRFIIFNTNVLSYATFLAIYLYWFCRDSIEYKKTYLLRRKYEIRIWWFIEVCSIAALIVGFLHTGKIIFLGNILSFLVSKDIVITVSLAFWAFMNVFFRNLWRGPYKYIYDKYLEHNRVLTKLPISKTPITWKKVSRILDFGCANGKRLVETLFFLGLSDTNSKEITGFDNDGEWENDFLDKIGMNSTFEKDVKKISAPAYDLVLLSHMLYEHQATNKIIRFLRECTPGAYVIIRGMSPHSFFSAISVAFSLRILSPTISYLWNRHNLRRVVEEVNLKRISKKDLDTPDLVIKQDYRLDDRGIGEAERLLGYLYGPAVGERAKVYFKSLQNFSSILKKSDTSRAATTSALVHPPKMIPNDDYLYIFQKNSRL